MLVTSLNVHFLHVELFINIHSYEHEIRFDFVVNDVFCQLFWFDLLDTHYDENEMFLSISSKLDVVVVSIYFDFRKLNSKYAQRQISIQIND